MQCSLTLLRCRCCELYLNPAKSIRAIRASCNPGSWQPWSLCIDSLLLLTNSVHCLHDSGPLITIVESSFAWSNKRMYRIRAWTTIHLPTLWLQNLELPLAILCQALHKRTSLHVTFNQYNIILVLYVTSTTIPGTISPLQDSGFAWCPAQVYRQLCLVYKTSLSRVY